MKPNLHLDTLPHPVLENIAYHVATETLLGPPHSLNALVRVNSKIHGSISCDVNPHLHARIFAFKFDTSAPIRRFGADLTVKSLATELRRRFIVLKRLRSGADASRPPPEQQPVGESTDDRDAVLEGALTTAYLMMLENDGKNETQLREYAQLEDWLSVYWFGPNGSSGARSSMSGEWWPANNRRNDMAMWLFWFLLTPGRYTNDDFVYREILSVLKPLALGAHKYAICTPSWRRFIPTPSPVIQSSTTLIPNADNSETSNDNEFESDSAEEPGESDDGSEDEYYDDDPNSHVASLYTFIIPLRPAPMAGPATLAYLSLANQLAMVQVRPTGSGEVAPVTPLALASGYPYDLSISPPVATRRPISERWDYEYRRCLALGLRSADPSILTYYPSTVVSVGPNTNTAFVYQPGSMEGVWEGVFTYTEFTSYAALLGGAGPMVLQRSMIAQHRQTWKLREYHLLTDVSFPPHQRNNSRVNQTSANDSRLSVNDPVQSSSSTSVNLGPLRPGDPLRAYIPPGASLIEHRDEGLLDIFDPAYMKLPNQQGVTDIDSPEESGFQAAEESNEPHPASPSSSSPAHTSVASSSPSSSNNPTSGPNSISTSLRAPQFPTVKYTRFDARQMKMTSEGGEGGIDYYARIKDVIIIGEGHSAWGQFNLFARVRPCDGFISFSKEYVHNDRGKWLYRGYLVGVRDGNLVGRWRDTMSPQDTHGYEGCFAMSRRR